LGHTQKQMKKQDQAKIIEVSLGLRYADIFKRLIFLKLEKSDAIIFLQGDRLDRAKTVKELYQKVEKPFISNVYEDISSSIKKKIRALQIYKTELREFPHPRSLEGIKILAKKKRNGSWIKIC